VPDPSVGAAPAARAALQMRVEIARLNAARAGDGGPPIGFGVGIHTGEVILGAVGIPQRSDFTAIGDTVNTAARLQEVCKEVRGDLVISTACAARLDGGEFRLRDLGTVAVRGKAQPLGIHTIESP
jgi:adenylate cyclase